MSVFWIYLKFRGNYTARSYDDGEKEEADINSSKNRTMRDHQQATAVAYLLLVAHRDTAQLGQRGKDGLGAESRGGVLDEKKTRP